MDLFLVRLLLSFLIGGTWVTIITESTVKYGPRIGGLLAGFPSTVAFSLAFIGWTQSAATAVEATTALPLALAFTAAFPLVYAFLAKGGRFRFALAGSLVFWGLPRSSSQPCPSRSGPTIGSRWLGFTLYRQYSTSR